MKSRQEIRTAEQSPVPVVNHSHHPLRIFWGIIALSLLILSLILNQTILNKEFTKKEIHRSDLATLVDNNLNSSLNRYGVSGNVVTKSDTDQLLDQAVDQIYSGESLQLDFNTIISHATDHMTESIAGVNLPSGESSTIANSALSTSLAQSLNSQLNTTQVQQFTQWLHIMRVVNQVVFWGSMVVLCLVALAATFSRQLLSTLTWLSMGSLLIVVALIQMIKSGLQLVGQQFPDYSSFLVQLSTDFMKSAMAIWWLLVAVFILSILLRWGRRWIKIG